MSNAGLIRTHGEITRLASRVAAVVLCIAAGGVTAETPGKQIDPARLGVPPYPGARPDAAVARFVHESLGMDGAAYRTGDKLADVVAFYRGKPGIAATGPASADSAVFGAGCKEEYVPVLKQTRTTGCRATFTIQSPWMDMGSGQMMSDTLITVVGGDGH